MTDGKVALYGHYTHVQDGSGAVEDIEGGPNVAHDLTKWPVACIKRERKNILMSADTMWYKNKISQCFVVDYFTLFCLLECLCLF